MEKAIFNIHLFHDVNVDSEIDREIRHQACHYYDDIFKEWRGAYQQSDYQQWNEWLLRDIQHDRDLIEDVWRESMDTLGYLYEDKKEAHANDPRMLDRLGFIEENIEFYKKKITESYKKMRFYHFLIEEVTARSVSNE